MDKNYHLFHVIHQRATVFKYATLQIITRDSPPQSLKKLLIADVFLILTGEAIVNRCVSSLFVKIFYWSPLKELRLLNLGAADSGVTLFRITAKLDAKHVEYTVRSTITLKVLAISIFCEVDGDLSRTNSPTPSITAK